MTGMATTASVEELATERAQCIATLAAAIREATGALAALDIDKIECRIDTQAELCEQITKLNESLLSESAVTPVRRDALRELAWSLRTYATLLRRVSQWVEVRRNMLRLVTGFSDTDSCLGHRLSY